MNDIIFHPNGRFLLSASDDKSLRIWDLNSGRCYRKLLNVHDHFVTCLDMQRGTAKTLITGSVDNTLKVWGCRWTRRSIERLRSCSLKSDWWVRAVIKYGRQTHEMRRDTHANNNITTTKIIESVTLRQHNLLLFVVLSNYSFSSLFLCNCASVFSLSSSFLSLYPLKLQERGALFSITKHKVTTHRFVVDESVSMMVAVNLTFSLNV